MLQMKPLQNGETKTIEMTKRYWLSCNKFTVGVTVNDQNIIIEAAPITRTFIGQPLSNLINWMEKLKGFKLHAL